MAFANRQYTRQYTSLGFSFFFCKKFAQVKKKQYLCATFPMIAMFLRFAEEIRSVSEWDIGGVFMVFLLVLC